MSRVVAGVHEISFPPPKEIQFSEKIKPRTHTKSHRQWFVNQVNIFLGCSAPVSEQGDIGEGGEHNMNISYLSTYGASLIAPHGSTKASLNRAAHQAA